MTVYSLTDLKKSIEISSNVVWPYLHVQSYRIGLVADEFIVYDGEHTVYVSPKKIVDHINGLTS